MAAGVSRGWLIQIGSWATVCSQEASLTAFRVHFPVTHFLQRGPVSEEFHNLSKQHCQLWTVSANTRAQGRHFTSGQSHSQVIAREEGHESKREGKKEQLQPLSGARRGEHISRQDPGGVCPLLVLVSTVTGWSRHLLWAYLSAIPGAHLSSCGQGCHDLTLLARHFPQLPEGFKCPFCKRKKICLHKSAGLEIFLRKL